MRKEFINNIIKLAEKDKNIYLLTGDLGFSFFEEFRQKFPDRFINCGVAEQNMMGMAAGLALCGKKVYVYSIIPFIVFRCFEQIRNDIIYQNLDVKIIGGGAGLSYGTHGMSHYATEDISVLRVFPNISIFFPADPLEMEEVVLQSYKTKGPVYIRLDKNAKNLWDGKRKIEIGKPSVMKTGKDIVLIATGSCLETAISVEKKLSDKRYSVEIISMHTLKPVNEGALLEILKGKKFVFTIEEHRTIGGLASLISDVLIKNNLRGIVFESIGIGDEYSAIVGRQDYLKKHYKIDEESVFKKIARKL